MNNKKNIINEISKKILNNDKNTLKTLLKILEINSKIVERQKCEKNDAILLKENLENIGFKFDNNKTIEENAKDIVETAQFIFYNINNIWPVNNY